MSPSMLRNGSLTSNSISIRHHGDIEDMYWLMKIRRSLLSFDWAQSLSWRLVNVTSSPWEWSWYLVTCSAWSMSKFNDQWIGSSKHFLFELECLQRTLTASVGDTKMPSSGWIAECHRSVRPWTGNSDAFVQPVESSTASRWWARSSQWIWCWYIISALKLLL